MVRLRLGLLPVMKVMVGVVAVVRLVKTLATYQRSRELIAFWPVIEERERCWLLGSVPAYKPPLLSATS